MTYIERKSLNRIKMLLNQVDSSHGTKRELGEAYEKLARRYSRLIERSDRQEARLVKLNKELNKYKFHLEEKIEIELEKNRVQQEILIQQSKQAVMGEMIAHIAHQWRQPLNTLNGLIILHIMNYEKGSLTNEKVRKFEKKTNFVIQGMSQTINDFQNFLKPNKRKEVFSLSKLFDDTLIFIGDLYKSNSIKLEINSDIDIRLYSYPNELIQVFLNILQNTKDAFIENCIKDRRVTVTMEENSTEVTISFKNNAGRVDDALLKQLCKPYFTTKG